MKKLTLENIEELSYNDLIIVYQDHKSPVEPKPIMILTCHIMNAFNNPGKVYKQYGFMNLNDPMHPDRKFTKIRRQFSIESAIKDGYTVYATTAINRIYFAGAGPNPSENQTMGLNLPEDQTIVLHNPNAIGQIENFVFDLLRKHTQFLIDKLALTQYPEKTLHNKTEEFIKSL